MLEAEELVQAGAACSAGELKPRLGALDNGVPCTSAGSCPLRRLLEPGVWRFRFANGEPTSAGAARDLARSISVATSTLRR
jgi:hypothetical protein